MDLNKKYSSLLKQTKEGLPKIDLYNQYAWELSRIDTNKALDLAEKANNKAKKSNYDKGLADSFRTIAQCYWLLGSFSNAITYLDSSLILYKKLKIQSGEADVINIYGAVYSNMSDYKKSVKYYTYALEIREKIGDKEGVAKSMNSIGDSLMKLKKYDKALDQFQKILEIKHGNKMFEGIVLYNISEVHYHLNQFETAEEYISQCAEIGEKLDFALMRIYCKSLLGKIEIKKKTYDKAILFLEEALEMATEIKNEERIYNILAELSSAYELIGDPSMGLKHYKEHHIVKEKVLNNESAQKLHTIEQRLETERLIKEAEIERLKNVELKKAYDIIEENSNKITFQNKEITDSINYAQRIQKAILPSRKFIKSLFPKSFVVYRPKDVLSGDFYWASQVTTNKNEKFLLASVADCTGHGVPGALMSIIGTNYLRLCEHEETVNNPAEALNFTNEGFSRTLRQKAKGGTIKDGMDISFIALDYAQMKLYFAGAKSTMFLIRNGNLTKYKGNSHPIGAFIGEKLRPFTNTEIDIKKDDIIYLFSDGYADQFGGLAGKKFMYKRFRDLLLSICHLKMEEQKQKLEKAFDDWRGGLEQLDDVCIMGIKL